MAEKTADKTKKKKKKWVPLYTDDLFGGKMLGECPLYETQHAIGRAITANYMTISGDMKKQHINLAFKIVDMKEGRGTCALTGYYIIPSSLRRFIRKGREKITDSFIVKTKDEKFVRIKPLLITNSTTHSSVVTNLRVTTKKVLQNVISNYTYRQLCEEIISYKLQKYLRDILHKTYPLKVCEIRNCTLLEKPPLRYSFKAEDLNEIIMKSRTAKKGTTKEEIEEEKEEEKEEPVAAQ
jgi:ribosomal protein S3AE